VLDNGWRHVSLLRGGGHIAEVRLKTGDPRKDLNPMRVPHYPTIDPHPYHAARDDAIYRQFTAQMAFRGLHGTFVVLPVLRSAFFR
jgi:hypothetical protein